MQNCHRFEQKCVKGDTPFGRFNADLMGDPASILLARVPEVYSQISNIIDRFDHFGKKPLVYRHLLDQKPLCDTAQKV